MTKFTARAIRGRLLDFADDPAAAGPGAHRYVDDGLLVIKDGRIEKTGPAGDLMPALDPAIPVTDHRPHLILPGFIDTHIHYPQTQVIASYGAQLLDWLNTYTFVEEQKFADPVHAAAVATFFFDELLRNGTTTAMVYCSVHRQSAEAFFTESARRNTRMIAGKVLMDRNAPPGLCDTAETGYRDSKDLIAAWHRQGRQLYAATPRFAVTSTEAQLAACGALVAEHADIYLQTHLSENREEIETVAKLFPTARDYTDVYERHGLLGPRSLFGHCIHLTPRERAALSQSKSVAALCPTSNLFIGSGLFDMDALSDPAHPVRLSLATDVGGGTSYSMLRTAAEAYKVLQLKGRNLPALEAFYMITRGNARALDLDGVIGGFDPGTEADFVVLNSRSTPAMDHRMQTVETLEEELFVLMTLGDDRAVAATYIMGEPAG